jgi:hypothetical protein
MEERREREREGDGQGREIGVRRETRGEERD